MIPLSSKSNFLFHPSVSNHIRMIKRIMPSYILIFFLLSPAVIAQSSLPSMASPKYWDPSFTSVALVFVCAFLFVGCFALYRCSDMDIASGDTTGATTNCSSSGPQGIDPNLLDTFPIVVYSAAVSHLKFGKAAVPECAVCLSEFDHQDTLRLLPNCNHVFHLECIDAWLASHVTCPVCRSRLKPAKEHRRVGNEVVIVIPNDAIDADQVLDESSASRTELNSGYGRSLGRCHSTGHSLGLGEIGGKDTERCTVTSPEDVRKQIPVNLGKMRRSASYDVFCNRPGEESSRKHSIL